jgi:phage shock protein E
MPVGRSGNPGKTVDHRCHPFMHKSEQFNRPGDTKVEQWNSGCTNKTRMTPIDLTQVSQLLSRGAQLVEVLAQKQFEEQHLPGAISLPLTKFSSSELAKLDKDRPIIVYCWDYQ